MPEQDAVVVITCESHDNQPELNLVWKYLLPAIGGESLPSNDSLATSMKRQLASLSLPLPVNTWEPASATNISGRSFRVSPNKDQIKAIRFDFSQEKYTMTMDIGNTRYDFRFGAGTWINGETDRIGPDLFYGAKSHNAGLNPFKVVGSYGWKDQRTLILELRYIESPHRETFICRFKGKKVRMELVPSNNPENGRRIVKGISHLCPL